LIAKDHGGVNPVQCEAAAIERWVHNVVGQNHHFCGVLSVIPSLEEVMAERPPMLRKNCMLRAVPLKFEAKWGSGMLLLEHRAKGGHQPLGLFC
jgi:hypothetical protein